MQPIKLFTILCLVCFSTLAKGQTESLTQKLDIAEALLLSGKFQRADSILKTTDNPHKKNKEDKNKKEEIRAVYLKSFINHIKNEYTSVGKDLTAIADDAENEKLYKLACEIQILLACAKEYYSDWEECEKHLNKALYLIEKYNLENCYAYYYLRRSSYHRVSGNKDSALYYIRKGLPYAEKEKHYFVLADTYLVLGMLTSTLNTEESASYNLLAYKMFIANNDYKAAINTLNNNTNTYLRNGNIKKAKLYNDSALHLAERTKVPGSQYNFVWKQRSRIFEKQNSYDSALYYYKMFAEEEFKILKSEGGVQLRKVSEQYENDKKEATIQYQNKWLVFTISASSIIAIALLLLYLQNRKIKRQNKTINNQVKELSDLLNQKNILFAEIQHRVKNNLLQVQSLLDIQEESIEHNSLEEVIRENKNRIQSMALLQKKLSNTESLNEIDFESYITELANLVESSYRTKYRNIHMHIDCSIGNLSINKGMPLGLIAVELISNSIKHAFKTKKTGNIYISAHYDESTRKHKFTYSDDGIGFDFKNNISKGLGIELIKGFANQIGGFIKIEESDKGFCLSIYFK